MVIMSLVFQLAKLIAKYNRGRWESGSDWRRRGSAWQRPK